MKPVLVGDITVHSESSAPDAMECLNAAFKHFELQDMLPTNIIMNEKTFECLCDLDPDNNVIYPDDHAHSGWAIWYASLELKNTIPDNKFLLAVSYNMTNEYDDSSGSDTTKD